MCPGYSNQDIASVHWYLWMNYVTISGHSHLQKLSVMLRLSLFCTGHLCSQLSPSSQGIGTQRKLDSEPCQLRPFPDGSMPQGSGTTLHSVLPMSSFQMSLGADSITQSMYCKKLCSSQEVPSPGSQHSVRAWEFSICPAHAKFWDGIASSPAAWFAVPVSWC